MHLDPLGDLGQLAHEAVAPRHLEADAGHLPGTPRHLERPVDPTDLQDEDPVRAHGRCAPHRDRVDDAAVEEVFLAVRRCRDRRRKQPWHGCAGDDGRDERSAGEPVLSRALDAGRADAEGDRELFEGEVAELVDQTLGQRLGGVDKYS